MTAKRRPHTRTSPATSEARRPREAARDRNVPDPPRDPTRPARRLSGRMLVMAGVLLMLVLLFAPTVRSFINQQQQISQLNSSIAHNKHEVSRLKHERAKMNDPDYVRQLARKRLLYTMPGEKSFIVINKDKAPTVQQHGVDNGKVVSPDNNQEWYSGLWDSVQRAGTQRPTTVSP